MAYLFDFDIQKAEMCPFFNELPSAVFTQYSAQIHRTRLYKLFIIVTLGYLHKTKVRAIHPSSTYAILLIYAR